MAGSPSSRRIALVTGGIGSGVVLALARRDFDVVVSDRAIPAVANDLRSRAAAETRLACVKGDLADLADHPRFVDEAFVAFGRLDCLVNNAGVSVKVRGDLLDVSPEGYDRNFAVNTRRAFFLTQAVCKRMLAEQPSGPESALNHIYLVIERDNRSTGARRVCDVEGGRGDDGQAVRGASRSDWYRGLRGATGPYQNADDRGCPGAVRQASVGRVHADQPLGHT